MFRAAANVTYLRVCCIERCNKNGAEISAGFQELGEYKKRKIKPGLFFARLIPVRRKGVGWIAVMWCLFNCVCWYTYLLIHLSAVYLVEDVSKNSCRCAVEAAWGTHRHWLINSCTHDLTVHSAVLLNAHLVHGQAGRHFPRNSGSGVTTHTARMIIKRLCLWRRQQEIYVELRAGSVAQISVIWFQTECHFEHIFTVFS